MAKYFSNFPKTYYKTSNIDVVTNIMSRYSFEKSLTENLSAFYNYEIEDGDTPEMLAYKVYGSAERHWIILSFNNILDPQFDWPLSYDEFNEYIKRKYASVTNVSITAAGTGYSNGFINFETNDKVGMGANAYYTVNSTGSIQTITLINGGSGYLTTPNVIFSNSQGNGANIIVGITNSPLSWSRNNIKSYYKIETITTQDGISTQTKLEIDANTYANVSTFLDNNFILPGNTKVSLSITKETLNYYDYENEENNKKRTIKILSNDFVKPLEDELKSVFKL